METHQFVTNIGKNSKVYLYGIPKEGRDFGYGELPDINPKLQEMYADLRDDVKIHWSGDIRIGRAGIFGVEISVQMLITEITIDVWSEDTEYEFTRTIPLEKDFSKSDEDEGWTYEIEYKSTSFASVVPQEIEIHLDRREVTITFG